MSPIGLLTAMEKQVPLGRVYMRPIQWYLKRHWRVPESLEKEIPIPRTLHLHFKWWTKEENVPRYSGFYRRLKRRLGCSLRRLHSKRLLVASKKSIALNFLDLKAVLLALKRFQHLVQGEVVLVATGNTKVVAYINKEGGMRPGSLCALLWCLPSWCNGRHIVLKAWHIPGCQDQIIQIEWSLHQDVFDRLCQTWHSPQVVIFATRYNCKLIKYVSPVLDPNAWAV